MKRLPGTSIIMGRLEEPMRITVNGNVEQAANTLTGAELLDQHKLQPLRVAVEVNEQLVRRRQFEQTQLQPGDRVEIVTFVGGG